MINFGEDDESNHRNVAGKKRLLLYRDNLELVCGEGGR